MNIIFCVGEELSEREKGNHFELIKNQIQVYETKFKHKKQLKPYRRIKTI